MASVASRFVLAIPCFLMMMSLAHGGGGQPAAKRGPAQQAANPPVPQAANPPAPQKPGADLAVPAAVLARHNDDIAIGQPIQYHNISVLPVLTRRQGPYQHYTLLEQGVAAKTFEVRELAGNSGQAQVGEIEVRNTGEHPVYLLGGEMILGGKQDRIIAQDTVVPRGEGWLKVSVFCVEQGRWQGQNMKFSAGSAMADTAIRKAAMTGSQSEVWQQVSKKNEQHGTQTATQTYRRTIQNADVRKKIRPYVNDLKARLPRDHKLAGLVFGVNGTIHVVDIFGNPDLFQNLSDKLLSAYVLEALGHQVQKNAAPVTSKAAESFVSEGRNTATKQSKKAGRARNDSKENDKLIGAETVDEDTGKTVRETYIGK
jgi:hypothetical protein